MNSKLKELRLEKGYTSKMVADKLGISKPFYSQIENGRRRLSYDMAVKISKIFNKTPDQIFYEDHKKKMFKNIFSDC